MPNTKARREPRFPATSPCRNGETILGLFLTSIISCFGASHGLLGRLKTCAQVLTPDEGFRVVKAVLSELRPYLAFPIESLLRAGRPVRCSWASIHRPLSGDFGADIGNVKIPHQCNVVWFVDAVAHQWQRDSLGVPNQT